MPTSHKQDSIFGPSEVKAMFNAIAPTYDLLNHLLSLGLDIRWRKKALRLLEEKRGGIFLDIAAGSGDLSTGALRLGPRVVVAADFAIRMLEVFRQKAVRLPERSVLSLVSCDAHHLPFPDGRFDVTMVAFGIRNFADRLGSLREMHRVLNKGGITMVLELTRPTAPVVKQLYGLYANLLLPLIGRIISRSNSAYRYLPESIAHFPEREDLLMAMTTAGFTGTEARALSFGIATIFIGRKA
jgi:demethylmenaquinone methyltransferase/2-methoxy-6-polyprenyl-1,4-benzoquinol methylase